MANIIVYTRAGLGKDGKQMLIETVKQAVSRGLKLGPTSMPTVINEFEMDSCNETAAGKTVFYLYTAPGKGVHNKALAASIIHEEMVKNFDAGIATEVIFCEHPHENVGLDGILRADDASTVAALNAIGEMR